MIKMEQERHVLVMFPHPDDEAFAASGTIMKHIENKTPVTYVCGTLGEMGRNMGNPPFANRETLPEIRKKELVNACEVMGIKDVRMLGLRDKTIEFENQDELAESFLKIIVEVHPSTIITFYPGYSVHPDHDSFGAAVVKAVEKLPETKRPSLHCVAFSHDCEEKLGKADIHINIHDIIDKKIAALNAHRSQIQNFRGDFAKRLKEKDPETMNWIGTERFWHYQWPKDK